MRFAVCNVGFHGFRSPAGNAARLAALRDLVAQAAAAGCDGLLLPGGFLTVDHEDAIADVLVDEEALLQQHGVSVVLGVDVAPAGGGWWPGDEAYWNGRIVAGNLPMFAISWTPAGVSGPWRQRSIRAEDRWLTPPGQAASVRTVTVAGIAVGVLVCGEMFHEDIRATYRASGVQLAVDCGHVGAGWRAFRGLEGLTRPAGGVPEALACAHVAAYPGRQYRYRAGTAAGARAWDLWFDGPPWASGAIFDL